MMKKIQIIAAREFITRIKKKSFILMTILGPILFAATIILPLYFSTLEDKEVKVIAVVDSSKVFIDKIPDTKNLKFRYIENVPFHKFLKTFQHEGYWGVLNISHIVTYSPNSVTLYSYSQPGLSVKYHIENALKKEIERLILQANNLQGIDKTLDAIKSNVNIRTIKLIENGQQQESNSELAMIVGYVAGILIYFFVLIFGTLVMRGVIEEKSNRIIEIIISSVKPFELMLGKIIGIAGVAITQFFLWIVLSFFLLSVGQQILVADIKTQLPTHEMVNDIMKQNTHKQIQQLYSLNRLNIYNTDRAESQLKIYQVFDSIKQINFVVIIISFLIYFLGGYLLYASLFAAIGSAVDNETDTQQFMLPITIPLIFAIYVMIYTINNPDSALSFWCSIIPFTSPVVMMVRIPFGVPYWQVVISIVVLVISFIFFTWFAGKIYRTGILMYGKKVSYKELWKWLKY